MKRQQLKVWTTSFVVSVIRHQSLVLFTAAGRPHFTDSIDSANDAAQVALIASGSISTRTPSGDPHRRLTPARRANRASQRRSGENLPTTSEEINTLGGDMHKWTVRAARVALVAAAISAVGAGVANADNTSGDGSILGGEQIHIPIIAPIGLFGNHVNVLSSMVPSGYRLSHVRMDDGTDVAPQMDICGNAISGNNGVGTAACKGQATLGGPPAAPTWAAPAAQSAPAGAAPADDSNTTIGAPNTAIGAPGGPVAPQAEAPAVAPAAAQVEAPAAAPAAAPVEAPAAAPVDASAMPPAAAPVAAPVAPPATPPAAPPVAAPVAAPAPEMVTSGDHSIAGGNQIKAPVRMPIRVCGNAGALGGMATAACEGTASTGHLGGAHHAFRTLGVAGLLG